LTQNVKERIKRHNDGRGNRFTKYRRPLVLLHTEEFRTKSQARKRELQIKGLTREKKLSLIKGYIAV
jgi:putative endonuclease